VIDLWCEPQAREAFGRLGEELRFALIVSDVRVRPAAEKPAEAVAAPGVAADGVWLSVAAAEAPKCARCWHRREDVGNHPGHPELCGRCVTNVEGPGERRRYA
jgi:isoleucyl-tRNA synthetase